MKKKTLIIFRKETTDSNNLFITKAIKKTKSVPSWWPGTFGAIMLKRDSCLKHHCVTQFILYFFWKRYGIFHEEDEKRLSTVGSFCCYFGLFMTVVLLSFFVFWIWWGCYGVSIRCPGAPTDPLSLPFLGFPLILLV